LTRAALHAIVKEVFAQAAARLCERDETSAARAPQSVLWAQVKNGTESHRPRATRFKAPPHH
jgi:hypothetical protein